MERWFTYRNNRNKTAHDYGVGFAEKTPVLLPQFVADTQALIGVLDGRVIEYKANYMLDLKPHYLEMLLAVTTQHLAADTAIRAYGRRVNGDAYDGSDLDLVLRGPELRELPYALLSRLRDAFSESNPPIFVDVHDWARLPESFHARIPARYEVLRPAAAETLV